MSGHHLICGCPACAKYPAVHRAILQGSFSAHSHPFLDFVGQKFGALEKELGEELTRLGVAQTGLPNNPLAATSGLSLAFQPVPFWGANFPAPPGPFRPGDIYKPEEVLKAKSASPVAPFKPEENPGGKATSSAALQEVKEERKERSSPGPLEDLRAPLERSHRKKKEKHRSRSRKRKRKSDSSEGRKPRKDRKKDPSEEGKKGDRLSPKEDRGKERKTKEVLVPRAPSHFPPRRGLFQPGHNTGGASSGSKRQGPGWRGPLPWSRKEEWRRGKNKGIVKRAKQARHREKRERW